MITLAIRTFAPAGSAPSRHAPDNEDAKSVGQSTNSGSHKEDDESDGEYQDDQKDPQRARSPQPSTEPEPPVARVPAICPRV